MAWQLVNSFGQPIGNGEMVTTFRGEIVELVRSVAPHKPSSSGHVHCKDADGRTNEWFPAVINAKFVQQ